jgi:hypothetical protein
MLQNGVPVASLEAGQILSRLPEQKDLDPTTERLLRIGTMSPALRAYYAR